MNINKKFLILLIFILQLFSINFVSHGDETLDQENQENKEKSIDLDDEELPAIDPFQSSSAGTSGTSLDGISGNAEVLASLTEGTVKNLTIT